MPLLSVVVEVRSESERLIESTASAIESNGVAAGGGGGDVIWFDCGDWLLNCLCVIGIQLLGGLVIGECVVLYCVLLINCRALSEAWFFDV